MTPLAKLLLWTWIPVILVLFWWIGPRRAVIASVLVGTLFLPFGGFNIPSFIIYDKFSATGLGILLGILVFDPEGLKTFRPSWLDVPMLVWCVVPFFSMLANDFGVRDAVYPALTHVATWGFPYLGARLYLRGPRAMRELAIGIVLAGLAYVPLCLWEVRMSPQLHRTFYGFHQRTFFMLFRYEGYRPLVFLQSPLMVGLWMSMATVVAFWLWRSGDLRRIRNVPLIWLPPLMALTTILGKTAGAITLMFIGVALFYVTRITKARYAIIGLLLISGTFPLLRSSSLLERDNVIPLLESIYHEERIRSLSYRMYNEDLLAAHALDRPLLGWGGWGRDRIPDPRTGRTAAQDSLWIIAFGKFGFVGLISLIALHLLAPLTFLLRAPPSAWTRSPAVAPAALATVLVLVWIDKLANAMHNPIYLLMIGGLTATVAARAPAWRRRRASARVSVPA
jgi:hypothetical protein